jgi:hypothetical protein
VASSGLGLRRSCKPPDVRLVPSGDRAVSDPETRIVVVEVDADAAQTYGLVSDPRTLPLWAPNFALAVEPDGEGWKVTTADGPAWVAFAPANDRGVADHVVTLEDGTEFYNPVRVVSQGAARCRVEFTLQRQPDWSEARFDEDTGLVQADLDRLKALIEAG